MKNVERKIIKFIQKIVKESNGVIVGLSGGIDSAVVATLCTRALGNKRVTVFIMPEHDVTKLKDVHDAKILAHQLNIKYEMHSIDEILNDVQKHFPGINCDRVAYGNAKARARMILLYTYANTNNYLVAGTGNKSELLTGYFTKYGDGAVDFLPIADLYKTDVIKLAHHLNIPKSIIEKEPSAGLWRGQTDEEDLGMNYEELDRTLIGKTKTVSSKKVKHVKELMKRSKHKQILPQICKIR